jgi:hypothetical protein
LLKSTAAKEVNVKRVEIAALTTGIAGLLLAVFAFFRDRRRRGVRGVETAAVVLQSRNGTCQVVAKDNPIHAGRGAVIMWAVDNRCDTTQEVTLTNFRPSNPLDRRPPPRSIPGGQTRFVTELVRPNAEDGTYHYAIALNGVVQTDPEIIIEY